MAILLMNSHAFGEIPIIVVFYLFLLVFQITNNVFLVLNESNHVNPPKKIRGLGPFSTSFPAACFGTGLSHFFHCNFDRRHHHLGKGSEKSNIGFTCP